MRRIRPGWVAVTLALVVVVVVVTASGPQRAAVNGVPVSGAVARLAAGATLCQGGELVPEGTSSVRVYVGAERLPAVLHARLDADAGGTARSAADGFVSIPVARAPTTHDDVRVCLTNRSAGWLELGGRVGASDPTVTVDGEPQPGRLRIDYFRGEPAAKAAQIGLVAERFGLGKAGFLGSWTLWAAIAASVGALVAAALLMRDALREER